MWLAGVLTTRTSTTQRVTVPQHAGSDPFGPAIGRAGCSLILVANLEMKAVVLICLVALPIAEGYMSRYTCNSTDDIRLAQDALSDDEFICAPYVNYTGGHFPLP
jgi:hypothetical protein